MLEAYRADDRFRKPWMICSRYIVNASANTRVGATRLGAGARRGGVGREQGPWQLETYRFHRLSQLLTDSFELLVGLKVAARP